MTPETAQDMAELRAMIDAIDADLVRLLARRAACIDRAVDLKPAARLPARIESRVEEVVAHVRAEAMTHGLEPELVEDLWRRLIEWSIAREEKTLGKGMP